MLLHSCGFSCNIPDLPLTAGLLAWLHADDPVPTGGLLHLGGLHPDDCVGQGEAPQLPEGVPRLPSSPLTHPTLHLVEDCVSPLPHPAFLACRSQVKPYLSIPSSECPPPIYSPNSTLELRLLKESYTNALPFLSAVLILSENRRRYIHFVFS